MFKGIVWDIESNGLLDESTVDYTASPYRLKDSFKMHCIVVVDKYTKDIYAFYDGPTIVLDGRRYEKVVGSSKYVLENYNPVEYKHMQLQEFPTFIETYVGEGCEVIAHNQINFDLLACKLYYGMDYTIEEDTWAGKKVEFVDTLVLSKTLNPDRFGGHSLDELSSKTGVRKVDFRPHVSKEERFRDFAPDMLYYNIYDCLANLEVYHYLKKEQGSWKWDDAISLEKAVADIITRQSHRGFKFNKKLAEEAVKELDALMEERRLRVEPLLPPKKATKTLMKEYTPPKIQFKKDGSHSSNLIKWIEKHGGKILDTHKVELFGKEYDLPLPTEPLITEQPATINDSTHIKEWLVSLGWNPTEWKEKDLSVDTKKQKLSKEKFIEAVDRYVKQTLESPLCNLRCEFLETTPEKLKAKLLSFKEGKPVRVQTNPSFTVGQEKELCPDLERIAVDFPYVKDVVEYLTYRHRRNSILGGGLEWDEEEDAEKGFLSQVREDGRIPTPADTCGAATSRMKHKGVANIARVTSLYGETMRALFGVDKGFYQIGYDFDSLEAREEAHYCFRYENEPREYCNSLLQDKPHDVHTMMAKRISGIIKKEFARGPAKAVKYACLPMHTKVLTKSGWKLYEDISEGETVLSFNPETGVVEEDEVIKKHYFEDKEVFKYSNKYDSFQCTEDHRWYGWKRKWAPKGKKRDKEFGYFQAKDIVQEHNIVLTAPYVGGNSSVTKDEAFFVGLLLSDGYYSWSKKREITSSSGGAKKDLVMNLSQSLNKYWQEVEQVLQRLGFSYFRRKKEMGNGNHVYTYHIRSKSSRPFLDRVVGCRRDKHDVDWVQWVLNLKRDALEEFYRGFYLGDGNVKGSEVVTQKLGNIFDAVATAAQLLGKGRITFNSKSQEGVRNIRVQRRKHMTCQELSKESLGVQPTFCLTTKNGSFIIWQDDFMGITGNCTYGAQPAKIAKTIGADIKTGEVVFNAFWEAAEPLAKLKEKLKQYWENTGQKKFILGIDGRKVPTRSAHAILNSLFQSAGVICAKRAMVIHDRLLKEHGLSVDFFSEDWKNKEFCQQLIAYHDEAQMEVSKSLVKFKTFSSEEEAAKWKAEQKEVWSDIKPNPKGGYFVAYSLPGELAVRAVREAGRYYKLNVDLTAGYMVGLNWAMCH